MFKDFQMREAQLQAVLVNRHQPNVLNDRMTAAAVFEDILFALQC